MFFFEFFLESRSSALSYFSLKKVTCLHGHYANMTSEQTQCPLQKRKLSHWPLMWQGHIDIFWRTLTIVVRRHVWERDNEHAHGLPYWKFSRGGRGATFLPSNMAQELQISVFDRLSMKKAHLIEIWILSLQYNDSLKALLEGYAKNRTKIETWNQIIVNRTERS